MANEAETEELQEKEAEERGTRFGGSPGDYKPDYSGAISKVKEFATKLEAGSPVSKYKKAGEEQLKALYAFDRQLEGKYDPLAGQRTSMYGADVVPNPADIYVPSSQYIQAGARGVGDIFEAIGAYKSLEGNALQNVLGTIFGVLQLQEKRKQRAEDRAWEIFKWQRQQAQSRKATASEKAESVKRELLDDAQKGVTLGDLQQKYGDRLSQEEIVRLYTGVGFYGEPEEPYAKKILGVGDGETTKVDQRTLDNYKMIVNQGGYLDENGEWKEVKIQNLPKPYKDLVVKELNLEEEMKEKTKSGISWWDKIKAGL